MRAVGGRLGCLALLRVLRKSITGRGFVLKERHHHAPYNPLTDTQKVSNWGNFYRCLCTGMTVHPELPEHYNKPTEEE
jgi:hypothetical protein